MTENLNEAERSMLCFIGKRYLKHYDPIIRLPEYDFEVIDGDPVDMVQNIIQALRIRGYLSTDRMLYDIKSEVRVVCPTEKALIFFNSEEFKNLQQENFVSFPQLHRRTIKWQ